MKSTPTVLLIDDDAEDQELFFMAMEAIDRSIACVAASSCEEGLKMLSEASSLPDIIFLDLNMPRMNGKECLLELKKSAYLQHIPVVIYSTSIHKTDMDETSQSGAVGFLCKPRNFSTLTETLQQMMKEYCC